MRNIIPSANITTWANPEHPVRVKPDGTNDQLGLKRYQGRFHGKEEEEERIF